MFRALFYTALTPHQVNILVEDSGHIFITDFSLAKITKNPNSARSTSSQCGFTMRWVAPEVWLNEEDYSEKADVFSFAMVMIEVRHRQYTT